MAGPVAQRAGSFLAPETDNGLLPTWTTTTDYSGAYSGTSQPASRVTTADGIPPDALSGHQRFVVADPIAFRYLEEDRSVTVLDRKRDLHGYQCYLVEQWACSRTHPTFIITAFTGNESHVIQVGVLSTPAAETAWSPRLKVYFKALTQYYARRKETPFGSLMVTNLSGFPSALTIIPIPEGDAHRHREDFFVNENLKRLSCSGRVGINLAEPSAATQAKFYQLYHVSEQIPLYGAVIELVKLCQAALLLFGCIVPEYVDGLLCDPTEKAINDWWVKYGMDLYNIEPTDGILGPTTVAALLGTLIGARNRLSAYGAPIAKDVFELESTKRAIAYFQKAQRLPKTRRFDRATVDRLHKATAKQAAREGWNVPGAIKSTVAELSGKGGEMMLDMVGRSEKATIADVESTDIERFAANIKGERGRWLWHGRARKRTTRDLFSGATGEDDYHSTNEHERTIHRSDTHHSHSILHRHNTKRMATEYGSDTDGETRKGILGRAKGRLKDAVGIRSHSHTSSKDTTTSFYNLDRNKSAESFATASTDSLQSVGTPDRRGPASQSESDVDFSIRRDNQQPKFARHLTDTPIDSDLRPSDMLPARRDTVSTVHSDTDDAELDPTTRPSASKIYVPEATLHLPPDDRPAQEIGPLLQRTQSLSHLETLDSTTYHSRNAQAWPRQLSFSAAESSIGIHSDLFSASEAETSHLNPRQNLALEKLHTAHAIELRETLAALGRDHVSWVTSSLTAVSDLNTLASQDAEQLNALYYPRRDEYRALAEGSREIIAEERNQLEEAAKELETLGAKLEYEIESLSGKVQDVEGAVADFEKQVVDAEGRVRELMRQGGGGGKVGWWEWLGGLRKGSEVPRKEGGRRGGKGSRRLLD